MKIACPKCNWKPDGKPYWACSDCGTVWDTFSTAARCPTCKRQYEITACIPYAGGCTEASPHLDWYTDLDRMLEEELARLRETVGTAV